MYFIINTRSRSCWSTMPIRTLSPELQTKAVNELNEVPSRIQNDLQHIRGWLKKQPHINARTDDQWLLAFLRSCKFSLEQTKEKLDLFYSMRTLIPEFFANRDPLLPEIQELLDYGTCIPLAKTSDASSKTTILIRHKAVNTDKIGIMDVLKVIIMTLDILINEDDNFVIAGVDAIQDLRGIPLAHLMQMTPSNVKKTTICCQNAYPARPQKIHFLNTFSPFESLLKLVKIFMNDEIVNGITTYTENNAGDILLSVPATILPKEYGGEAGSIDEMAKKWKSKVESYREWFLEDASYYSNETKRPGKPKTSADVFGVEGSFRKLDVD